MKKIVLFFMMSILLVGCFDDKQYTYAIKWAVHYPDTVIVKIDTVDCSRRPKVVSDRGSNYIYYGNGNWGEQTTAPIELINVVLIK